MIYSYNNIPVEILITSGHWFILYEQIKKALRGVKVEVTHRGNMRRKYRISGLTSQATRELTYDECLSFYLYSYCCTLLLDFFFR